MPFPIADNGRVKSYCFPFAEIKREIELPPVKLQGCIINLVLVSHVVNQASGGKGSEVQLDRQPRQ